MDQDGANMISTLGNELVLTPRFNPAIEIVYLSILF